MSDKQGTRTTSMPPTAADAAAAGPAKLPVVAPAAAAAATLLGRSGLERQHVGGSMHEFRCRLTQLSCHCAAEGAKELEMRVDCIIVRSGKGSRAVGAVVV